MRIDPGGGSGFQVDPASLSGVAGQLGRVYDDYNTVIADFYDSLCYSADAFGDSGVGQAWTAFNTAWGSELSVDSDALAEAVRKVSTSAQLYQETEDNVTAAVNRVLPA
ncbi:MAG TPA: hypothetical protein VGM10_05585 [Actinocrinis sp.]|jgi:hypothetical protein